jgi:PEP-CTERM motif
MNGQTTSLGAANLALPDTSAYAAATVSASSPFLVNANATGQVTFSREFSLTGSPDGWDVTLSGDYAANGTASGADVNSSVILDAAASVRRQPNIIFPALGGLVVNYKKSLDATVADPSSLNVPITAFTPKTAHLANGNYFVFGLVQATTHVDSALFSSGVGRGGIGATFTLNATPATPVPAAVPEPSTSTMLLLGGGLIAVGILRRPRENQKAIS